MLDALEAHDAASILTAALTRPGAAEPYWTRAGLEAMATLPASNDELAAALRFACVEPWCFAERPRWALPDDWSQIAVCVLVCAWLRAIEAGARRPTLAPIPPNEQIWWTPAARRAAVRVPDDAATLEAAVSLAYRHPPHFTFRRQQPQESMREWTVRALVMLVGEWLTARKPGEGWSRQPGTLTS
jgi:hypothetical protein